MNQHIKKFAVWAGVFSGAVFLSLGAAQAQMGPQFPGGMMYRRVIIMRPIPQPVFHPMGGVPVPMGMPYRPQMRGPAMRPLPPGPIFHVPSNIPIPGVPGGINPRGRDVWGVAGPAIGAATAGALDSYGVPAPISGWAGSRVAANAASAYREHGAIAQALHTFTGISLNDIQKHGWRGGPNSVVNQLLSGHF